MIDEHNNVTRATNVSFPDMIMRVFVKWRWFPFFL
jgi:hypothetical protein